MVVDTGDITDWGSEPEATYVGVDRGCSACRTSTSAATTTRPSPRPRSPRSRNAVVLDNKVADGRRPAHRRHRRPALHPGQGDLTDRLRPVPAGRRAGVRGRLAAGRHRCASRRQPVDIALVHDPESAAALAGVCPMVLAGHTHEREVRMLPADARRSARAALHGRGLDRRRRAARPGGRGAARRWRCRCSTSTTRTTLQAYDDIQVGGTGQAQVTLNRTVVEQPAPRPARPRANASPGRRPRRPRRANWSSLRSSGLAPALRPRADLARPGVSRPGPCMSAAHTRSGVRTPECRLRDGAIPGDRQKPTRRAAGTRRRWPSAGARPQPQSQARKLSSASRGSARGRSWRRPGPWWPS